MLSVAAVEVVRMDIVQMKLSISSSFRHANSMFWRTSISCSSCFAKCPCQLFVMNSVREMLNRRAVPYSAAHHSFYRLSRLTKYRSRQHVEGILPLLFLPHALESPKQVPINGLSPVSPWFRHVPCLFVLSHLRSPRCTRKRFGRTSRYTGAPSVVIQVRYAGLFCSSSAKWCFIDDFAS